MGWTATVPEQRLAEGRPVVVRSGPRLIALLARDGKLFAFDNRCPHEGYPLAEGRVDRRCVLTCEWHNWKFDLADGHNLFGTDHLRVYPTRVRNGLVEVQIAPREPAAAAAEVEASLKAAFEDRQYERLARGLARLHCEGLDPVRSVALGIHWSAERLEYGMTHAYAASADWLALHDESREQPERALAALLEALDHMAADALRLPRFPFPDARESWDEPAFAAAVEAEDESAAIARLNGALAEGRGFAELEGALARVALAHYRDFGHSLIYLQKVGALIAGLGDGVAAPLLRALVRSVVYATREDLIPSFRGYALRVARLQRVSAPAAGAAATPERFAGLGTARAMDRVLEALAQHPPEAVLEALLESAGTNLLHFDTSYGSRRDVSVSRSVGWLDLTHTVTFAAALKQLAGRHPELWGPGLLQLACFSGRVQPFLDPDLDPAPWRVADAAAFFEQAVDRVFDHGLREPIFACHRLKTALAARALAPQLGEPARSALLAGTRRFLESPLKQKHVLRTVQQALALVGLDYERGTQPAAG